MNIRELLNENMIELGAELNSKDEALDKLIELQKDAGAVRNTVLLSREIRSREMLGSSAVSMRNDATFTIGKNTLTIKDGISYDSPDKRKVRLMFMVSGKDGTDEDTDVKARIMHLLMDSEFTARLCAAKNKDEFLDIIDEREKDRYPAFIPDKKYDCSRLLYRTKTPINERTCKAA